METETERHTGERLMKHRMTHRWTGKVRPIKPPSTVISLLLLLLFETNKECYLI